MCIRDRDELCPGIMGESLLAGENVSGISSGNFTTSNATEGENREMINILTPRLPKFSTFNDIDEGAGSYTSSLGNKAFTQKSDTEEKTSLSPKAGIAIHENSSQPNIEITKSNIPVLQGLAINAEQYGFPPFKDTSNCKVIPKSLYDDLNRNLQTLHLEAQQKELETARHYSCLLYTSRCV